MGRTHGCGRGEDTRSRSAARDAAAPEMLNVGLGLHGVDAEGVLLRHLRSSEPSAEQQLPRALGVSWGVPGALCWAEGELGAEVRTLRAGGGNRTRPRLPPQREASSCPPWSPAAPARGHRDGLGCPGAAPIAGAMWSIQAT